MYYFFDYRHNIFQNLENQLNSWRSKHGQIATTFIRDNLYAEVVNGNWWDLASLFAKVIETMISEETDFTKEL